MDSISYITQEKIAEKIQKEEPAQIAKYAIKDSVFTSLFRDKKYLLQLYMTLHPEDTEATEASLTDITIQNVLTDGIYNDLGFMVGDRLMILVEAQSTWTMNIIIRAFMYLAQTYHDYFEKTQADLYGSRKVNLPRPELYVIFTGERTKRPETISLTEEFFGGKKCAIEVTVKMIYGDDAWKESAPEDSTKMSIISQYIIFTKVYNEQRKLYKRSRKTITETIRICKNWNILKEYLAKHEKEVIDIMMSLFDEERIVQIHIANKAREAAEQAVAKAAEAAAKAAEEAAKAAEEAAAKAAAKAAEEATAMAEKEAAEKMLRTGKLSVKEIAECFTKLSVEDVQKIRDNLLQTVG